MFDWMMMFWFSIVFLSDQNQIDCFAMFDGQGEGSLAQNTKRARISLAML
jgi:hypothetical protein